MSDSAGPAHEHIGTPEDVIRQEGTLPATGSAPPRPRQATPVLVARRVVRKVARHPHTRRLAKHWVDILGGAGHLLEASVMSFVLGINVLPKGGFFAPVFTFAHTDPIVATLACAALLLLTLAAYKIARTEETPAHPDRMIEHLDADDVPLSLHLSPLATGVLLTISGYVLFFGLLVTVVTRPGWCPPWLCTQIQPFVAGSTHDADLELYWQTFESPAYVVTGDPASYTLANLSSLTNQTSSIGAVRTDQSTDQTYRVVIFAHSLLQSGYPIRIEQVNIQIIGVPDTPNPLNVTPAPSLRDYANNPYLARYHGEPAGGFVPSVYQGLPGGHVELVPRETDQLDIQVTSSVAADIQFRVQVVYRVANESTERTLTLNNTFTVVFANSANWHLYTLQNGRLTAQP